MKPNGAPRCWGDDWEGDDAQCQGGQHPTEINPRTNTRWFEKCGWESSCRPEFFRQRPHLIPPERLAQRVQAPVWTPQPTQPVQQQQAVVPYQQQVQYYQPPPQQQVQQHQAPHIVVQHPQQVQYNPRQDHEMQGYLTVHQDPAEDGFGRALMKELGRSAAKAMGHSFAYFMDHVPIPPSRKKDRT